MENTVLIEEIDLRDLEQRIEFGCCGGGGNDGEGGAPGGPPGCYCGEEPVNPLQ